MFLLFSETAITSYDSSRAVCFAFAGFKISQQVVAGVSVGGPFLNFLPVISKEKVKCFEKGMYTELLFEGHVQVLFCPCFLLYALEVKREQGLNLRRFIKVKQFIVCESLSFSESHCCSSLGRTGN